jgi:hypothetical protein
MTKYLHWSDVQEEEEGGLDESPLTSAEDEVTTHSGVVGLPSLKFSDGESWKSEAKCLGKPELLQYFFAEGIGRGQPRKPLVDKAKAICAECTVRSECFKFAKLNNFLYGVWGGIDFHTGKGTKRDIPEYVD